ncbi:hypothetical protein H2248_011203 [Termitomyces sp. 'cryptogamus']|nr:hypothetical protein H2248_011203 [Termitomyces sp. 'cryptogamus']
MFISIILRRVPVELLTHLVLVSRLSGLVYLRIQAVMIGAESLRAFEGLPRLAYLSLPRYSVTTEVLEILAYFPALRDIRTNNTGRPLASVKVHHHPFIFLRSGAFHLLRTLTFSGCPCQISDFVENIHFPTQIRSLSIDTMQCNRPYYISLELQRIVKKCRKLTELALRDVIPQVVTLYSDLEIFLAYNLTRLRIDSYWSSL